MCGGLDWQALSVVIDLLAVPEQWLEQVILDCIVIRDHQRARET
jgi:hypothetical protein